LPAINRYTFGLMVPTLFIGALLTRSFLATARFAPVMDWIIKINLGVLVVYVLALAIFPPEACRPPLALLGPLVIFTAIIRLVRAGYHPARYFLVAHLFRTLGTVSQRHSGDIARFRHRFVCHHQEERHRAGFEHQPPDRGGTWWRHPH
jgi:hypothetical protein